MTGAAGRRVRFGLYGGFFATFVYCQLPLLPPVAWAQWVSPMATSGTSFCDAQADLLTRIRGVEWTEHGYLLRGDLDPWYCSVVVDDSRSGQYRSRCWNADGFHVFAPNVRAVNWWVDLGWDGETVEVTEVGFMPQYMP